MRRGLLKMTILTLVAACGPASAQPRGIVDGVYSDLKIWEGSGDANGIEVRLRLKGPAPTVEFMSCAGGCIEPILAPAMVGDRKIEFDITEQTFDEHDAPLSYTTHYVLTRQGGGLRLLGENRFVAIDATLKRTRWRER